MLETGVVTGAKGTFSAFKGPGVRGAEVSAVMQKGQVTGKRGGTRTTLKGILKSKSSIQAWKWWNQRRKREEAGEGGFGGHETGKTVTWVWLKSSVRWAQGEVFSGP